MEIIKPPNDFHAGTAINKMREEWSEKRKTYPQNQFTLDLSDVIYMDSHSFRTVFDFLPMFTKVIPPKSKFVIEMYDMWLDSKKGLSKGQPMNKVVVVTATWCGPCKVYKPVVQEAEAEIKAKGYQLEVIDADENSDFCATHALRGVPTTIIFENGEKVNQFAGGRSKEALLAELKDLSF